MIDQIVNNICYCRKFLTDVQDLSVLLPCEHLIHTRCWKSQTHCPYCNQELIGQLTRDQLHQQVVIEKNPKYLQPYIDILALRNGETRTHWDTLASRMFEHLTTALTMPYANNLSDIQRMCLKFCADNQIFFNIHGQMTDPTAKQVIIANHSNYFDALPVMLLTAPAFLAAKKVSQHPLTDFLSRGIPRLFIERGGKSKNTVEQMRGFIENKFPRLALFPEGTITHQDTLAEFRSGAFHIGYPIQPMILRYSPNSTYFNIGRFMGEVASQSKLVIDVTFLEMEYPPFTPERIAGIRRKMAEKGGLLLSRISNRMTKD